MFEYYGRMNNASEPAFLNPEYPGGERSGRTLAGRQPPGPERSQGRLAQGAQDAQGARTSDPRGGRGDRREAGAGVLKAMSPGVVDFLFRRLVAGEPAEDLQWGEEGTALEVQPPGAELARRLSETDLDALTPAELFHYVRAAQRLAAWAESLREAAVGRYCSAPPAPPGGAAA